jgi:hypothetical protein
MLAIAPDIVGGFQAEGNFGVRWQDAAFGRDDPA